MPRRIRLRKVVKPPTFKSFKPTGSISNKKVELKYEEYEALRLADYDMLNHKEAAELMGVSRPTFARIYENARMKIALALVENREIQSVYGDAYLEKGWLECTNCLSLFTLPSIESEHICPLCGSQKIEGKFTDQD